jgi:TolA-binding protein
MRLWALFLAFLIAAPVAAQSPEEQLAAASALFDAHKYAEAAQRLETFLTANPKHAKAGPAALALARSYVELKQFPKAIPAYEKAIATKDPAVLQIAQLGLGEAALQSDHFEKAASALDAAVKSPLKPEQGPLAYYWLGQADFELKRFAPAQEAYLKVTRDYPRSDLVAPAFFGAGLAALRQNKPDECKQYLKTVVERYPKAEDRPQAMLILAQLDLEAKRYREARSGFETLLQDPGAKSDEQVRAAGEQGLVTALLELQDFPAATSRLEAILARLKPDDPQRYRAQLSLGHCRYRQKQYEPALAAYHEAAKSTEGAVAGEGHYWAGNSEVALKRNADAAVDFAKVVSRFPKHELAPKAQLRAGDALLAANQPDAAAAAYRVVVEKYGQSQEAAEANKSLGQLVLNTSDPVKLAAALKTAPPAERARGTLRLARLYLEGKKYPEAEKALTELVQSKPAPEVLAEGQYLLGVSVESREGPAAQSAAAYGEALRLQPNADWSADAQGRLAWLYLDLKKPAEAERAAGAVLAGKPEKDAERQARLALVQAQLDQEKWDAALESCRTLLAGNPPPETVATVLYTQAWVADKRNKPEEGLPLWERLSREFPKSQYASEAGIRIGDARFKAEKYAEARDQYQKVLAADAKGPQALEARYKLGTTLYNLDQFPDAAAQLDQVAADKTAGDYLPEALYWSGRALEKADKKEDAIQRYTRLTTQFPKHSRTADAKLRLAALKAVAGK